jgi:hypothetical protein
MRFNASAIAVIEPKIDQLVLSWLNSLRKRSAADQELCDIGQKIQFLTVDIITKICLGDEIGCVEHDCDMYRILETVEHGSRVCQYFSVFLELNTLFFQLARISTLRGVLFPKRHDSTGVGRLMGVCFLYTRTRAVLIRN